MITIDGSQGEGGGQIIRSSLALSLISQQPFTIENIRAGRKKPGLMRQHLTAVRAAAEIGDAQVEGDAIGARRLTFHPRTIRPGEYEFRIGTAGSTTLVLQTVLPALLTADAPSRLILEGGTHNPFAPPFDFIAKAYLPLIRRMGPKVNTKFERYGFYPAGGGRYQVDIVPTKQLRPIDVTESGEPVSNSGRIIVANLPENIATRERNTLIRKTGWEPSCFEIERITKSPGPGNVVMLAVESAHVTELVTAFGQVGVKAERVAQKAVQAIRQYQSDGQPVGHYLADQIMLPMAIGAAQGTGGGQFATGELSLHALTHIEIIQKFLPVSIQVTPVDESGNLVRIGPVD